MYRLCSYKIYFHIISVLIVCGQEFDSQISASNAYIHRRPIGSNNIQPIHKHQQHRNHNVVLNRGTAAHPTISSRPEFTSERPNRDRESHHSRRDTRHLTHPQWRQQMPYNTNDDNIKSFNDKHQMLSHNSYQQHQQKRSPIHQKPQRKQKPSQVANRKTFNDYDFQLQNTRYPEIVENERHLRIQPPFSRDEEFGQNHGIDSLEEHNLRHFVPNSDYPDEEHHNIQQDDNLDVDNMIANPEMHFMNQIQNNFNHQYRRPNAEIIGHNNERPESSNLGLKTVLPKNRDKNRIESNMRSFEAFSSDINHEENDKQFPNYNLNEQQFVPSNHQSLPEEQTEEYFNSPETDDHNNDNQYQTNHNYFPPLNTNEEESQKIPAKYQTNKENNLHFFGDRFKQSDPKNFYNNRQHKQNKANQQNIQNYGQQKTTTFSRSFNNPYESINVRPKVHPFQGNRDSNNNNNDNNNNNNDIQRIQQINKQRNHQFVPFYENYHNLHSNNIQKTTKRPNNLKGKPIKKEIAIVREITEIIPQNADNHHLLNDDQFDDTISIATPSPPKLPNIFMSFDEENDQKLVQQPDLGKDEHFYDDEEYMILDVDTTTTTTTTTTPKPRDIFDDEDIEELTNNKFAKEVDLSADELEKYFDKEFIVEQEKNEDGTNQQVVFDDEPKESNQEVSKKDTEKTNEKIDENNDDMELEYKSSDDFHKNHENFLQNIEKENEKFRQRTDDKLTETDSDEIELDQTNNTTNVESDVEKELDSNSEIKDNNDSEEDKQKSDNNNNDSNEQNNNNNGVNDNDNKDSKSGTNDTEDDEESESKQVSEKEEIKEEKTEELKEESKEEHSDDEKNNNKQNSEQTEEDKEKNDKQNIDNKENEETTNDDKSDDEKVDEDKSDDKEDKELLKEESKESKNELIKSKRGVNEEQEDNRGQESVAKHTAEKLIGGSNGDSNDKTLVEMKPNKLNKTLRISQNHNFAPVFIDLKRINPNLKITTGVKNGETEHTTHWPTTSATDIKSGISSQSAIDEHKAQYTMNSESKPAITGKNHTTTGLRYAVNSIKDIIKSFNI